MTITDTRPARESAVNPARVPPQVTAALEPGPDLRPRDLDAMADDTHAALWLAEHLAHALADAHDPARLAVLAAPLAELARADGWEAARQEYEPPEPLDIDPPALPRISPDTDRLRYPPHGRASWRAREPRPDDFPDSETDPHGHAAWMAHIRASWGLPADPGQPVESPANDSPPATAANGAGGNAIDQPREQTR